MNEAGMKKLTAGDPETKSADILASNIEALRRLFPEAFREGGIDFDVLKQLLGESVEAREERYGFSWHGKRRARQAALAPSTGTLLPCPRESVEWDLTNNIIIKGDNLETLKLLQKSYAEKVKMIYIDPPYNTGKDFIYPDDFRDNIKNYLVITGQAGKEGHAVSSNTESSGRFHTNWINMMYPRLKLARTLLRDDGVMFISIDDGEVSNLRMICDELFGEENFIANVVWQKKYTRANDAKWFSDNHDHILVYARSKESVQFNGQKRTEDQLKSYSNPDNHPKGPWKATPLHAKSGTNAAEFSFKNGIKWSPPKGTFRRFNDESMRRMEEGNEIWFGSDGRQVPQRKSFLSEVKEGITPVTLWSHQEAGHNHEANNDLKALALGGVFNNPKPIRLVRLMIDLVTEPNNEDIVLDFFAGSGTTAHAVLDANATDGGNRRFICVQLQEPLEPPVAVGEQTFSDIAQLTVERARRAAAQIGRRTPRATVDLGFRVFRLAGSNIRAWEGRPDDLERTLLSHVSHLVAGRSEEDILTEILLKLGLDLCVPIDLREISGRRVYSIGAGALMVCLADDLTREAVEAVAQGIVQWQRELSPAVQTRVIFKDAGFVDDVAKSNLAAILTQSGIPDIRSL